MLNVSLLFYETEVKLMGLTEEQKKHQEEMRANREKVIKRKERTRRLIIRGVIAEKMIPDAETLSNSEFQEKLYQMLGKHLETDIGYPQDSRGGDSR